LNIIAEKTGIGQDLTTDQRFSLRGPQELDIVYSGLEEVMCTAVEETMLTAKKLGVSYRIAVYVNALNKLHASYQDAGITM